MPEKAICAGIVTEQGTAAQDAAWRSLEELSALAEAAGAEVVGCELQGRGSPDPATFIGSGKLEEIRVAAAAQEAELLICDEELTGSQMRNMAAATGCRVIDRTMLILDIFALNARSHAGRLQVELAQMQYQLSHLTGQGAAMSRLGGGIGTRGPGESQLETDRRHIYRRIQSLKKALDKISRDRHLLRQRRQSGSLLNIAVVGYTNAGKSTLINRLCGTDLLTADQVFATLDPAVRRLELPDHSTVLLTDTVGFIRKLPHHLVDAFQSTLDEVRQADAILQVMDAADPDVESHLKVVEDLLSRLDAADHPRLIVFNKADQFGAGSATEGDLHSVRQSCDLEQRRRGQPPSLLISAENGQGITELLDALTRLNLAGTMTVRLLIPYREAGWLDYVRQHGRIDHEEYRDDGIDLSIHIAHRWFSPLREFRRLANPDKQG